MRQTCWLYHERNTEKSSGLEDRTRLPTTHSISRAETLQSPEPNFSPRLVCSIPRTTQTGPSRPNTAIILRTTHRVSTLHRPSEEVTSRFGQPARAAQSPTSQALERVPISPGSERLRCHGDEGETGYPIPSSCQHLGAHGPSPRPEAIKLPERESRVRTYYRACKQSPRPKEPPPSPSDRTSLEDNKGTSGTRKKSAGYQERSPTLVGSGGRPRLRADRDPAPDTKTRRTAPSLGSSNACLALSTRT